MFAIGSIIMLVQDDEKKWIFLSIWIIGSIVIFLFFGKIKKVEFDGENFEISNYLRSEKIHKSNIKSVSASILLTPEFVWFNLKEESSFGKKILFMPKVRFPGGYSFHPTAKEIKNICNLN